MTSTSSVQTAAEPAQVRPRVSAGSTLLPLLALGILFLILLARAAFDTPQAVTSAQIDPRSPVEANSAL